ncbi:MAG TPA: carboxypeptidase regulatory-like domain-containing protein [Longimicrobiales bacterium]
MPAAMSSPRRLSALLAVALFLAAAPAAAQSVRGELIDGGTNTGIAGATVRLMDPAGREQARAVTDAAGHFAIQAPTVGDYYLQAEADDDLLAFSAPLALRAAAPVERRLVVAPPGVGISLAGTVRDSTRGAPLANAMVVVAGTDRAALTDAAGRFVLSNVPPGTRTLWFQHPRLDSLGLRPITRTATVRGQDTPEIALATPSTRTIYTDACGADAEQGRAVVIGFVRDARSGIRLSEAGVHFQWAAPSTPPGEVTVQTDAAGRYRACGIPMKASVRAVVSVGGLTDEAWFHIGTDPLVAFDLEILDRTPAHIVGQVVDHETSEPIAAAAVSLHGLRVGGITDAHGRFHFDDVPPGTYLFEVRHIAYGTTTDSIVIPPDASLRIDVRLAKQAIALEPITVTVQSEWLENAGFYRRRELGLGRFATRAEITEMHPLVVTDVLRRFPGITIAPVPLGGLTQYVALGRGNCRLDYVIDGIMVPAFDVNTLQPEWIEGLEIHLGPTAPLQFGITDCGMIIIWTRDPGQA